MPVYPGAQDFHLQVVEHAQRTTNKTGWRFRASPMKH
jgi:hypothetical protein